MEKALREPLPPREAIPLIVEVWRSEAEASGYVAGCPVVAAALGGEAEPGAREIAARAFTEWTDAVADWLAGAGVPADRTASLANLLLSAVEGAVEAAGRTGAAAAWGSSVKRRAAWPIR